MQIFSSQKKKLQILRLFLLLTLLASSFSCKTNQESSTLNAETAEGFGLDVNDVSILFPLPPSSIDMNQLVSFAELNTEGKAILSKDIFLQVLQAGSKGSGITYKNDRISEGKGGRNTKKIDAENYDLWRIVSLRFDPCFPALDADLLKKAMTQGNNPLCIPQIRLIAQPYMPWQKESTMQDFSFHLLFNLSADQRIQVARDLLAIKVACAKTSGKPLGIHPCLAIEASSKSSEKPVFTLYRSLIKRYATDLKNLAFMGVAIVGDPWIFYLGNVEKGKFEHKAIDVILPAGPLDPKKRLPFEDAKFQMLTFVGQAGSDRVLPYPSHAKDHIADVFKAEFSKATQQEDPTDDLSPRAIAAFQSAIASSNRVENPHINTVFSSDCISCHVSSRMRKNWEFSLTEAENPVTPDMKDSFLVPAGITGYVSGKNIGDGGGYNLRSFGYFADLPSITLRTAHESALVADFSNRLILNKRNPWRRTCDSVKLRTCLSSIQPFPIPGTPKTTEDDCLLNQEFCKDLNE